MTASMVDRPGKELPKYWRDLATGILAHPGWSYEKRTKHPAIISPAGLRCSLPTTVTDGDAGHRASYLTALKRIGAPIDRDGGVSRPERRSSVSTPGDDAFMALAPRTHIDPIITIGQWWHPAPEEEPEPEPVVEPAPVERRYAPRVASSRLLRALTDDDAQGTDWTLAQAYRLIRQGYHVKKVVQKTGWGKNWFRDMIDESGYCRLD